MKERVFNITLHQNCLDRTETSSGVFVLDGSKIKGYVIKQTFSVFDSLCYIYGIYNDKDTNITSFIQMSMDQNIDPVIFAFLDPNQEGSWSNYDHLKEGFFAKKHGDGICRIELKEVIDSRNADNLRFEAFRIFNQITRFGPNLLLLSRASRNYMSLLYNWL